METRDTSRLTDRTAIVTGAATGFGEVYAHALAREGAKVVLADVDLDGARRVEADLRGRGWGALAVAVDVTDEAGVARMVEQAASAFGGIDILVNNAGLYLHEYSGPCAELPLAKWRRLVDVNLTGALICAAAVRPSMCARGGGVIVNQSSVGAYMGIASAYGVSKRALNALTVALAVEFAPDKIRVNGLAPSSVESDTRKALRWWPEEQRRAFFDQQLIKRVGHMNDLANALIFLCSDQASFITAQTLPVDGGLVRIP
jgi:NAD(P)-dependent dehydrogenase (short-subunit alcohol dehydrogenase family)